MSQPRWWRVVALFERDGDPWTWTFHVRALSERRAHKLVAERIDRPHDIITSHPSDPLPKAPREDEIAAEAGPWRRSWDDPVMKGLRA